MMGSRRLRKKITHGQVDFENTMISAFAMASLATSVGSEELSAADVTMIFRIALELTG